MLESWYLLYALATSCIGRLSAIKVQLELAIEVQLLAGSPGFTMQNLDQLVCTGSSTRKLPSPNMTLAVELDIKQKINLNLESLPFHTRNQLHALGNIVRSTSVDY